MQTKTFSNLQLKDEFLLDPEVIFLNHGSFGATPRPVFDSYQNWQRRLEAQPVKFLGRDAGSLLAKSRASLGRYLGTQADQLVYVTNATTGLNIVARSLALKPGDEVLTSDHEYGALDRTWKFLSKQLGFKYINQPIPLPLTSPAKFVEDFWAGVTPQTRVIFLSHITSPTAVIFPVEEICQRARQMGILTIIDGAHAPGQIPLTLDQLGADFYSGNLHKWLCAPKGSAFLYARPEVQHLIQPLIVSWGWESENPGISQFVDYLEWAGTRDISAFLAVPDAISFQLAHSWDAIRAECHLLAANTQNEIARLTRLSPLHSPDPYWFMQMASSPLPANLDPLWLKEALYDRFHIEVPVMKWKDQVLIRYSFQAYNSLADSEALIQALESLLAEKASPHSVAP
ncbi:aminotransferase class V-fold PLP-dependent enzyme [Levilinea saccharolytica]|uniref:Aminotransferase class V n=1 Tax=Levilinea saccharolytica TaxID=229921 RepID=A0A0P6XYP1_9CHLR|nr:aminotransferase class V-fold PLP-dependent enzyme [Levilinea saccharolytica]KPL85023.1 aminotransferase class V [Levilinea saccharolytica]GAP18126.1 selenocysteine lyase [Levilinea saccharolytica]